MYWFFLTRLNTQLDGKSVHPNLKDQSGNFLNGIAEHLSFQLGCVTSPAHGTTHYIKFFSKVSNASGAQIIGFSAKYWVWILFSAEFWVESPYHMLKSVDLVQSWYVYFSLFFSAWATPTAKFYYFQFRTRWTDLSMWYGDFTRCECDHKIFAAK